MGTSMTRIATAFVVVVQLLFRHGQVPNSKRKWPRRSKVTKTETVPWICEPIEGTVDDSPPFSGVFFVQSHNIENWNIKHTVLKYETPMYPYQTQFQSIKLLCIFKTLGDSPLSFFDFFPFVNFGVSRDLCLGTFEGRCFAILIAGMINVSSLPKFLLLWYSHASNTYYRTKLTLVQAVIEFR